MWAVTLTNQFKTVFIAGKLCCAFQNPLQQRVLKFLNDDAQVLFKSVSRVSLQFKAIVYSTSLLVLS